MTRFPRIGRTLAAALLTTAAAGAVPSFAAGTPGTGPAATTTAIGSYLAGRFAQNQDDWGSAARYMELALAADPGDLALMRRTFLLKLGEGRIGEAVALARKLVERDPNGPFAITTLIADDLVVGKLADAKALVRTMPRDGMARYVAPLVEAWLLAADRQTDAAVAALSPLLAVPGFKALHDLHAGLILDMAGRNDAAAETYAGVTGDDAPLRVVQIVGGFYERTGRTEEAKRLYEGFRDRNPDSAMIEPTLAALTSGAKPPPVVSDARQGLAEALFDLGSAIQHEGSADTALLFGRIALHLRPDLALARLMIGDIQASRDHEEDAIATYASLQEHPVLGWAVRLRTADALASMERTDEAAAMLRRLVDERPERVDAAVRLGDVLRSAKRWEEAVAAYDTALKRVGTPAERHWSILYARAIAYDRTNRWPQAEADLKAALALRPEEPYLLNYLGYSWVDKGLNLVEARRMIERAVELRPRDGYIIDSLGWALYRLGDFEAAVTKLERAVELKSVDATINDHLGDAYWRVGRRNEARFQWQRALRTAEEDELKEQIRAKLETGLPERQTAGAEAPKPQ